MNPEPIRPATKRPRHPDGSQHPFNCCQLPDVWLYDDQSHRCRNCGYKWEL